MSLLKWEKIKNGSKIHNVFTLFGVRFKFFIGIANSLYVNKYLQGIKPYKSSSHKIWDVEPDARKDILKLDWNEASIPPSPKVMVRMKSLLNEDVFLNLYPKTYNKKLLELLAQYTQLPQENVQYFAGSDAVHEYISKLYIKENDKVLIQGPSYDNFRLTAEANGARVYYSEVDKDTFTLDEDKFKHDIKVLDPSFVYICSPNNPCGFVNKVEYVEDLLKTFPGTMFLIDEAYAEFSKVSVKDLVLKYDNILVTRTMSKAFALANLRFGYLLASKNNIKSITSIRNPKNIGTFTQEAAIATLEDIQYMHNYVEEVNRAKEYFCEAIKKYSQIKTFPSSSNFVLMKFDTYGLKSRLFKFLQDNNIFIRELVQSPILYKCLRITIGTQEQMKHVIDVIDKFFELEKSPKQKCPNKVALFDFCETIADFQTGDAFIYYVADRETGLNMKFRKFINKTMIKIKRKFNKHYNRKFYIMKLLKGLTKAKLDNYALNYYFEVVSKHFIPEVMERLLILKNEGYRVYVVSAGYDLYLKYFIEEFNLDGLLATKIAFKDDICLGKPDGEDCIGQHKITLLDEFFKDEAINDYETIAYSDSSSDIPLLDYCKEAYVVTPNEKSWVDNSEKQYKKLVWTKK